MNEDPTEKLIRELKEENERLLDALKKGGIVAVSGDDSEMQNMSEAGMVYCVTDIEKYLPSRIGLPITHFHTSIVFIYGIKTATHFQNCVANRSKLSSILHRYTS